MFLKKGIFVNWGNIPHLEFDFGPINLFSGGNGSGKTTCADAIQSLMTAAHENLFTYNPGQDETTQRGRGGKQVRTLASYLLGCDDGSFARPHACDGYVAGIFQPTQGEAAEAFSVVMAMRGHLDSAGSRPQARLDELQFLILPGEQLALSDLVREYQDGAHVVPITELALLLKKQFGSAAVEVYDKKGAYLRRLYGILRGKKEAVSDREAKHAARTFSNFMAYKPVSSINEFVAREILEPKDLGEAIRSVSELMKTIHGMESDARAILDSVAILSAAGDHAGVYIERWQQRAVAHYSQASSALLLSQRHYLDAKQQQQQCVENIAASKADLTLSEQRAKQLHSDIVALEAQRQGVQALKDKDQLEADIEQARAELVAQARPLLEQDQQLAKNIQQSKKLQQQLAKFSLATELPALESADFRKQLKQLAGEDAAGTGVDLQRLMGVDWIDIAPLEQALDQAVAAERRHNRWAGLLHDAALDGEVSPRDQLSRLVDTLGKQQHKHQQQLAQKEQEINQLAAKRVNYPRYVELAVAAIDKLCPEADPRVLCDYVEITDPHWQMAIEGYIGGARFSIMVEQAYEAEAIRIVRSLPGGRSNKAKVIQGSKAQRDADRLRGAGNSIIDVMHFSHKTAEYYLKASYGSVQRVRDADELRNTARGLAAEGLGSGSYSMWRCDIDDSELVFGQGARERALAAKRQELESLLAAASEAERFYRAASRVFELVDGIKSVSVSEVMTTMLGLQRQLSQAESQLANLDLSDFEQMEQQLKTLQQGYAEQQQNGALLSKQQGAFEHNLKQLGCKVEKFSDEQESLQDQQQQQEVALKQLAQLYPNFDVEQALENADKRVASAAANSGFSSADFADEAESLSRQLAVAERELGDAIKDHNQRCHDTDNIFYGSDFSELHGADFFKRIVAVAAEIDNIHNRLKNNVLVERFEKLGQLKDSFNTAFVTNLCHSIYQSIKDGKRILDDLNKELEGHRFGADRESFYFDYEWVREYYEYWQFFKEVVAIPNLGDGSTLFDTELSERSTKVRDKLMTMLLDKDEQFALKELARISDYRQYRNYEIYKQPEGKQPIALSQYGTGSGGQLETPAYIIRSAAVSSAFRFNEGSAHLRMVMVDEAFSKMDETRSREVINYLTETLGLQLVFIMPSAKSGPFLDLISNQFVFSKCPTAEPVGELNTRVLVDRKQCNREKIEQLWANHRQTVRHQGMLDFMDDVLPQQGRGTD